MTASALFDRLRPGLDPNDASWIIVRTREDWRLGESRGLGYDAAAGGLHLAPLAAPELAATWLPSAPVADAERTAWRVDPEGDALLRRRPCDAGFAAIPGIGGHGFATGRLDTPTGVAVDRRGRIWVADAGNGRVQVVDPDAGHVVAVLAEGLRRPVHVALGADGGAFVLDAATRAVHRFGPRFEARGRLALAALDPWSGEPWAPPPDPEPRAIAVLADGSLAIFDPMRAALWHLTATGRALPALPWFEDGDLPAGWQPLPRSFTAAGEVVVGPLDGGVHDLAWHRVLIEADLPPGCTIEVQTYADNVKTPTARPWAPSRPVAMPWAAADRHTEPLDRLVLAEQDLWPLWRRGLMTRDRAVVHAFDGTPGKGAGPVGSDTFALPASVALFPGDRVVFETAGGTSTELRVDAIALRAALVAASGDAAAFAAPEAVRLVSRDGRDLPFGPLALGFLLDAGEIDLSTLNRDGLPEDATLPQALARFLRPGDLLELDPGAARLEVIELGDALLAVTLERPAEGDFSLSDLRIVETARRLVVREELPASGATAPGTEVHVIDDVRSERHPVAWVEAETRAIWLGAGALSGAITPASWTNAAFTAPRATDRGRYLWLRLRLRGDGLRPPGGVGAPVVARATPRIRSLRVIAPRPSLLAWLPAIYSRRGEDAEPPGANFLERLLTLFEGRLTRIEEAYEGVSRLLNPRAADAEWLDFVAGWLDLSFDPSWPIERRRQLVIAGAALQAARGTPAALVRYLEIYTGAPVAIAEGFRRRPPASIELGGRGVLGVAPLGGEPAGVPDRFAHRFTVAVTLPAGVERAAARAAVRRIVEAMKPATTAYVLDTGNRGAPRIGIDTAVDAVLIPPPGTDTRCFCDSEAVERPRGAARPQTGRVPGGFRLGGRLGNRRVAEPGDVGG